jgi:predicted amidophosphoribosyltransferase
MSESEQRLWRLAGHVSGISETAYIGHYHPVRSGHQERVSASLRRFIEGTEPHLSRWIELAAPRVVAELSFDLIVRALRHDEIAAGGSAPLDNLCDAIAVASGKPYVPHRLKKGRATKPLEDLVGKAARAAEMDGVLHFDGSSIRDDARILVVDSLLWTGATLEAVARAIHESLPRAAVVAFVLTRADSTSNNGHLNADYFEGTSTDPAGAPARSRKGPSPAKKPKDARPVPAETRAQDPAPVPAETRAQDAAPVPARRSRISTSTFFIGGMALVFLIIGALVPLRSGKKPPDMPDPLVEPFEPGPPDKTEAPPPPPRDHSVRTDEPAYPQGVVIVPDAGLRQSASLDARMVGKARLRNGEQVSIMKKQRPDFGPSWVQIKTNSGKVGWVFASVVQERKARRK